MEIHILPKHPQHGSRGEVGMPIIRENHDTPTPRLLFHPLDPLSPHASIAEERPAFEEETRLEAVGVFLVGFVDRGDAGIGPRGGLGGAPPAGTARALVFLPPRRVRRHLGGL